MLNDRRKRRRRSATGEVSDAALLHDLTATFAEAAERAGDWLVCGPGCSKCCYGPFPVTPLDAQRLQRGLARLEEQDPELAKRVRARAAEARDRLAAGFPGDPHSGRLGSEIELPQLDAFFKKHEALACPVLDPASGRCNLYDHRPVACRTYGPPLGFGDERAPHCPLCFVGADDGEIERCRVQPDADGLEQELLARMGVEGGEEWETLIAFALGD